MIRIPEIADAALKSLRDRLRIFADGRNPDHFVGQFLDDEGCADPQHGVYGMGSWIALVEEDNGNLRNDPKVRDLTLRCKTELQRLVGVANDPQVADDSREADLRRVVPKICYAYVGLSKFADAQVQANQLLASILRAAKPGMSWGFLTNSQSACIEMTALVVRSFSREPTMATQIRDAMQYLQAEMRSVANPFLQLYALNTLLIHDRQTKKREHKKAIRKLIRSVLNQAFFNPTQFPNPINIDFNDAGANRTRYIRLATDVTLLESLELISGPRRLFLRGRPGRRVFQHITKMLKTAPTRDATGHRLTPPAALYLYQALKPITETRQAHNFVGVLGDMWAYLYCAIFFSVNLDWNVISVLLCAGGVWILYGTGHNDSAKAFLGALIKSALDLFKSLFNSLKKYGDGD